MNAMKPRCSESQNSRPLCRKYKKNGRNRDIWSGLRKEIHMRLVSLSEKRGKIWNHFGPKLNFNLFGRPDYGYGKFGCVGSEQKRTLFTAKKLGIPSSLPNWNRTFPKLISGKNPTFPRRHFHVIDWSIGL